MWNQRLAQNCFAIKLPVSHQDLNPLRMLHFLRLIPACSTTQYPFVAQRHTRCVSFHFLPAAFMYKLCAMDSNVRWGRQFEPSTSATSHPRYPVQGSNAHRIPYSAGAGAPGRYPPVPLNMSPLAARGIDGTVAYGGCYQEPATTFLTAMPQNTMPYRSEYEPILRQTQPFNACDSSFMYNIPQTNVQDTVYDMSQQIPPRPPTALQIMPRDIVTSCFLSEPLNTGTTLTLQAQANSSSTSEAYQKNLADQRAMLPQSSSITSISGVSQPASALEQVMEEQDYSNSTEASVAYEQYQTALKEIFTNIRNGALVFASESLLMISNWLLSKVTELGTY